jgi:hypothetical protein
MAMRYSLDRMSEEQGWNPAEVDVGPGNGGTSLTLEHDDGAGLPPDVQSVSVRLRDTGELPFLQPRPGAIGVEAVPGWMDRLSTVSRRPGSIVVGVIIAGLMFAAFMTQAGQDRRSTSNAASLAQPPVANRVSDLDAESSADGIADDGALKSSVVGGGPDQSDPVARSSGDAFEAGDERVLAVQVVEPVEALTNPTTTAAPPTTARPATAPPTTAASSSTTTEATTTTAEPTTTTTEATTTTTDEVVAEADGVRVTALSPGSTDSANAPALQPGDIILRAEGSQDILAYRFRIEVEDDGKWKRVESSGWRLRREFDTRFRRYDGRTIRWTVEGRTLDGTRTAPTPPLHISVESGRGSDG